MLRRYLPTLTLLVILLAIGGYSIVNYVSGPSLTRGPYVPTLSSDPETASLEALIFVAILGGVIFTTVGMGLFLAITTYRLTRMIRSYPGAMVAAEGSARPSGPKAPAKGQEVDVPFSSDRSAAIFWIVVALLVVGFQVLRFWSNNEPIGYLPGFDDMLRMPLFRLPGQHIPGLPPFLAGPGDEVTALHILIGVLINVVIATAVTGFIMARGFAKLSETVKSADRLKPTPVDRLIPTVEARLNRLRNPGPRRFNPANPIDRAMVGLNLLVLLTIGAIVAFYVVPSYSSVAAVDRSVEATRVAAFATAAPPTQDGHGQNSVELLKGELAALPAGQSAAGEQDYSTAACVACHSLKPEEKVVGPSLAGVATRAETRRPGYPPDVYIYESITHPDAYVVEGFQPLMPKDFKEKLTPQQLADLVAFLLTQK